MVFPVYRQTTSIFKEKRLNRNKMNLASTFESVQAASRSLALLEDSKINELLNAVADAAVAKTDYILSENEKDLARMDKENPKYDRLMLTAERLQGIADDIRNVATLPSPLGRILKKEIRPNGMELTRISVPFGVIGIIYEARPNVSFDVFSLCLKSGNACVLKGGSDADFSNRAIINVIHSVLEDFGIDMHVAELLPADREATSALLNAVGYVDLLIPRGSSSLINFVREHATIPVIETGAGICHTYFDEYGDTTKGAAIIHNAKTRRVSVCNALDCLIVHEKRLSDLPELCRPLQQNDVLIYADPQAYQVLEKQYPAKLLRAATEESFGTEFLSYSMAVKTVKSIGDALEHIHENGSKHSECIVTEKKENTDLFIKAVDAACVYSNVSTAFTDGAQFGLGAEIGISTQKLHARGPMALEELTSYKWIIKGDGQIRK